MKTTSRAARSSRSPQRAEGDYDPAELGGGLAAFRRDDKRYCGFLYLRPNRTGNRALSFGRVRRLHAELRDRGYRGGYGTIRDYVQPFRDLGAAPPAVRPAESP